MGGVYINPLNQPPGQQPAPALVPAPVAAPAAAPAFDYGPTYAEDVNGNYALGALVGFFFSFLGLLAAQMYGEHQTRRGAVHGFIAAAFLTGIRILFLLAEGS